MIRISDSAQSHFAKLLADQAEGTNIRVFVVNPGTSQAECGVSYCPADAVEASDIRLPFNGFEAIVDEESAPFLDEADIDFVTDKMGSQLTLKAPNAKAKRLREDASLAERVEHMLVTEVNPQLANHGGQVSLVEITEDGIAVLQFGGGCNGCSMIDVTLKEGIEKEMVAKFDEINGVRDITEHARGEHSYY
ncbi:iron-sulfur cluster biogenesis protein NfuA [Pseudoalteromonas sp. J010]|uniref:Fe/S biogenesis protein NfuA n=1 Tax=Pseudoalteromonas peptidolytica F12-50-A1 TaxID=1315280 RepID=A0A8I0T723_9GAMM|nr:MULTISPECIES: Fe-S biogenesis protein NfuA [Pseudoalteromonas]MBE0347794.1 Fe/S biogenesis protein NfuA [Pseudoalteromonas peptidolytica F12-50-A1]NLR16819.1 Fe-S biogenesis protein NfuA [Pseudoalteromonas peptidolytica]RRS07268.1 iron-sulfur cluster biogenesis protein NfuA [Pseudoalteromonas sp. J010]GEK09724.1 Fe/S biogenesis protein NfuA [Pseudoalteromonas peptidolytica]